MAKDETAIDKPTASMTVSILSDKFVRDLERTIKRMDPNAVIDSVITRGVFSQVAEGQRCVTCGYVNQAETEACAMCETVGQVILTIKRGDSSA